MHLCGNIPAYQQGPGTSSWAIIRGLTSCKTARASVVPHRPGSDSEAEQSAHEAAGVAKKAGKALEDGFAAMVQAPRHLAETVRHQVHRCCPALPCCRLPCLAQTFLPCLALLQTALPCYRLPCPVVGSLALLKCCCLPSLSPHHCYTEELQSCTACDTWSVAVAD